MAKKLHILSARAVATLTKPGRHADGGNLYLKIDEGGAKRWVFMFKYGGRQREAGLGGINSISLSKAREIAAGMREALARGRDPLEARQTERQAITFGQCADDVIAAKASSWRSEKHRRQWLATITQHAAPLLAMPVAEIDTAAVLRVLKPLWTGTPVTASRLRARIESVIDAARAHGHIDETRPNPARWSGHLQILLSAPAAVADRHHKALAYSHIPALMARLSGDETSAAKALQFLILTAARSGEARSATWGEIDNDARLWVIPAARMKSYREHRVPLSAQAMEILAFMSGVREGRFIFRGRKDDHPIGQGAMADTLRHLDVDATVHGLRSSFRDWCGDETDFAREVAEAALAHATGDATERSYRRGDALVKRRALMDAWGSFCTSVNLSATSIAMLPPMED
jgi:integrase